MEGEKIPPRHIKEIVSFLQSEDPPVFGGGIFCSLAPHRACSNPAGDFADAEE